MGLQPVELLKQLVATPSVNPMGRPCSGPEYFEHQVTAFLEEFCRARNLPYERQTIDPLRDNLVVRLDADAGSSRAAETVLLEVHQDTVPVTGMTIEPWTPVVRDGRLYGRGSCDVKGAMATMLTVLDRLLVEQPRQRPNVVLAFTVNEEHGFTGVRGLVRHWTEGTSKILPRAPDWAIVAEPTELGVVVAHKGVVRWRCHTHGRAAHSSQPQLGENAIYRMAPVLAALANYQKEIVPTLATHPLCGRPTLSVGTISGGMSVNTVPDRATIEIDRRVLPGEDPQRARAAVIEHVAAAVDGADWVTHDEPYMLSGGLSDASNGAVAARLGAALAACGITPRNFGVPFGTDASVIGGAGVPTVVFGPGSIDQAHTADEWIAVDQLDRAAETLYRVVLG